MRPRIGWTRKWVKRGARVFALAFALEICACSPTEVSGPDGWEETANPASARPAAQDPAVAAPVEPPRFIVLLSLDTLRADHLGMYGHKRFTSPVLDLIAAEGVVFEDASATSPWTLPSHASMLTGLFPLAHGVVSMKTGLKNEIPTLASLLGASGYETAAVVNSTWLKKESFGLTRNFDRYLYVPDLSDRRGPTTWVTDQAIEWMGEASGRKLFLFVHYYDVHADYSSEPVFEELFATPYDGPADGTGWQLTRSNFPDDYLEMCQREFVAEKCTFGTVQKPWVVDASVEKIHFDADDVRHLEEIYDAGIRQLDTELGRLFSWMRSKRVLDETLLVITSDHGEEFMEHGRLDHFLTTHQEVLRVPLILRGPGIPSGVRVREPVSIADIAPTVLGLARAPGSDTMDGLDLSPLFRSGPSAPFADRYLYGEAAGGLSYDLVVRGFFPIYRSVRRGTHKLVYELNADRHALYELASDPYEQRDISEAKPDVARELIAEMRRRYEGFAPDAAPEEAVQLSEEEIEHLRSLGYLQ